MAGLKSGFKINRDRVLQNQHQFYYVHKTADLVFIPHLSLFHLRDKISCICDLDGYHVLSRKKNATLASVHIV